MRRAIGRLGNLLVERDVGGNDGRQYHACRGRRLGGREAESLQRGDLVGGQLDGMLLGYGDAVLELKVARLAKALVARRRVRVPGQQGE